MYLYLNTYLTPSLLATTANVVGILAHSSKLLELFALNNVEFSGVDIETLQMHDHHKKNVLQTLSAVKIAFVRWTDGFQITI